MQILTDLYIKIKINITTGWMGVVGVGGGGGAASLLLKHIYRFHSFYVLLPTSKGGFICRLILHTSYFFNYKAEFLSL